MKAVSRSFNISSQAGDCTHYSNIFIMARILVCLSYFTSMMNNSIGQSVTHCNSAPCEISLTYNFDTFGKGWKVSLPIHSTLNFLKAGACGTLDK